MDLYLATKPGFREYPFASQVSQKPKTKSPACCGALRIEKVDRQMTVKVTSTLPRVAFEYGHT